MFAIKQFQRLTNDWTPLFSGVTTFAEVIQLDS